MKPLNPKKKTVKKTVKKAAKKKATSLRTRAESALAKQKERLRELSTTDLKKLAYELGTHQIELEMQNEELRTSQMELESSLARYADLYDFSPVGYFSFDKNGLIKEANLTGAQMLGSTKRILHNKPVLSFIDPAHRTIFRDHLLETFRTPTGANCELTLLKTDGAALQAQLHSLAYTAGGGETGVCRTSVSDVTERKRARFELEAVNIELEAFCQSISHDLRAPLRSIGGFTTAILEDCASTLDETGRDYLNRIVSASRRMSQLIDALLTLARLTRGEVKQMDVNLSALAEVIVQELGKKQPERQVKFIIAPGAKARGDITMLRIVLENLLTNAWKFTGNHTTAKIEFGTIQMEGRTVYFVRDDGAGFLMEFAGKLFKPFQRLHGGGEFPGLGIGLATADRIISRHGGRLWAESNVEKGATFYFTL